MAGWFWNFKFFQLYFLYALVFGHGIVFTADRA